MEETLDNLNKLLSDCIYFKMFSKNNILINNTILFINNKIDYINNKLKEII